MVSLPSLVQGGGVVKRDQDNFFLWLRAIARGNGSRLRVYDLCREFPGSPGWGFKRCHCLRSCDERHFIATCFKSREIGGIYTTLQISRFAGV